MQYATRVCDDTYRRAQAASRAYRVYASKSNDSEDNYLVDHSIVIYLVDQGGVFSEYFGKTVTAGERDSALHTVRLGAPNRCPTDEMTTRIEKILARA
jgi:cytochrome oxidase Cu insertion factor (SCO1/SenC/PrrC family)